MAPGERVAHLSHVLPLRLTDDALIFTEALVDDRDIMPDGEHTKVSVERQYKAL